MAIGYGNNIQYFFVFLLVSMGITIAWTTNKNIESLVIEDLKNHYVFAKEKNWLTAQLVNLNNKKINLWDLEFAAQYREKENNEIHKIEELQKKADLNVIWEPDKRGYNQSPRILVQSEFPFFLLRAWKYFEKPKNVLVFPERKGIKNLQFLLAAQTKKDEASKNDNEGLFRDYREFQNSDSPSRIDWKRSVKHRKHLVKNYEKSGERKILIEWSLTEGLGNFEDRLSQMTYWVDQCFQSNEFYSMKINDYQTDYKSDISHYKSCLEKLALLNEQEIL
jgi:uncharacterized protein (DUF58 family)